MSLEAVCGSMAAAPACMAAAPAATCSRQRGCAGGLEPKADCLRVLLCFLKRCCTVPMWHWLQQRQAADVGTCCWGWGCACVRLARLRLAAQRVQPLPGVLQGLPLKASRSGRLRGLCHQCRQICRSVSERVCVCVRRRSSALHVCAVSAAAAAASAAPCQQ